MLRSFDADRMYTYLKGFAVGRNMIETQKAMSYARRLHKDQKRKSGEPYIMHPLSLACHAIAMGISDDRIVATLLLHDIVEDCGVSKRDLPVSEEIQEAVELLSFNKPENTSNEEIEKAKEQYYKNISNNEIASICKIFDRCHNVSTMAGVFTREKLQAYLDETEHYVLPLIRVTKDYYPLYQSPLFILKYHIISVMDAIEGTIKTIEG